MKTVREYIRYTLHSCSPRIATSKTGKGHNLLMSHGAIAKCSKSSFGYYNHA